MFFSFYLSPMSKKNTRLIVVLLLLLIIGAYIYATKTPQTQEVTTENDSQRTVATTTTTETPTQPTGCDFTLDTSFIKNAKEVTETRQGDDNHITKRFYMQTQDSNFIKIAKSEPGSEVLKADGKYYFQFTALMSTPKDVWDAEVQASRSTCKTGGMEICLWELKENTSYTQK